MEQQLSSGSSESGLRSSSASGLKLASTFVDLVKNIVLLVVLIYVFVHARAAMQTVLNNVRDSRQMVTEVDVKKEGVSFKLEEAHKSLAVALNDVAKSSGKEDHAVSPEAQNISAALNATSAALQGVAAKAPSAGHAAATELWVYLGSKATSGWKARNFNLTADPQPGMALQATTDVYKRNAKPLQTPTPSDPDNLDLGDAVGVLKQGETINLSEVMQIHPVSGEVDWWGRIR